jgi:hypothetical protein
MQIAHHLDSDSIEVKATEMGAVDLALVESHGFQGIASKEGLEAVGALDVRLQIQILYRNRNAVKHDRSAADDPVGHPGLL